MRPIVDHFAALNTAAIGYITIYSLPAARCKPFRLPLISPSLQEKGIAAFTRLAGLPNTDIALR